MCLVRLFYKLQFKMDVKNLEPYAIIGFDGSVLKGLKIHPDGQHVVYPMGNKVCIQEWKSKKMSFLSGHTNSVSTLAISPKGTYIGSGQINHIGFKASAKLWDFKRKTMIGTHELHKVRVEALSFTSDERYMITLGGRDDGTVVIWDCVSGAATGTAAATKLTTGDAVTVTPLLLRHNSFVTAGDLNLRIWNIRSDSKSLDVVDVSLGKLRRSVRCVAVNTDDTFGYAGTTSGDLIKFSINFPADPSVGVADCKPTLLGCQAKCGPWRKGRRPESVCYAQGVEAIIIMSDGCLVVGAGDGRVELLDEINWVGEFPKAKVAEPNRPTFRALKSTKLDGSITSLELFDSGTPAQRKLLAGTRRSEIHAINLQTFEPLLVLTCHTCAINDIAFPRGMSGVFASAGAGDVRVWCLRTAQELLRVVVPNFVCSSLLFAADGKSIVTAWNDGNIRAFTPLTGRLVYVIYNTHNKGTSALDMTADGRTLVSGGCEGQVRVWDIRPESQTLKKVLKEHKSPVSAIQISPSDTEAVSAGTDGSCIIWDLVSLSRRQVLYANTLFTCVRYSPLGGGCQLLTGGTDRRVAYWEAGEGHLARELEASKTGAINGLDISSDGELFITGGNDQMVKLWQYQSGVCTHWGRGHAGAVTAARFAPDRRHAVSACAAGGIIVWKVPEEYIDKPPSRPKAEETAAESPKSLQQQLALPLEEKHKRQNKLPSAPVKVEKIEAIDTSRSSVHSCCPCRTQRSDTSNTSKKTSCRSPDNLPTRTTSKNSVNRCAVGK